MCTGRRWSEDTVLEQPQFGTRLRDLRLGKGLTQSELADDGMSAGYLSRLESGARPPTPKVVDYLTSRLGVSRAAFEGQAASQLAERLAIAISANGDVEDIEGLVEELRADTGEPMVRWDVLWLLAAAKNRRGASEDRHDLLSKLVSLSDELDVPELKVRSRVEFAGASRALGLNEDARDAAAEAVDLCRTAELPDQDTAAALMALVSAEAEAGLLTEARTHAEELMEITDDDTSSVLRAKSLWTAASVHQRQGDDTGALELMTEALDSVASAEDVTLWMRLRLAATSMELRTSHPDTERVTRWLDQAEPAVTLIGSVQHEQELRALRGHSAFAAGRVEEAAELVEPIGEGSQLSFRDQVRLEMLRSRISIANGDVAEGTQALQELAERAQHNLNIDLAAEIWRTLAESLSGEHGKSRRNA